MFEPIDVAAWAEAVVDMFPGNRVQLEGGNFSMNTVDASWEVGHVGVSDYLHQYWSISYQIAKSE